MKFSIITAVYNRDATVAQALASVAGQSHEDVEYLAVEGASTDDTMNVGRRLARPGMRVISEPDPGICDALNKGIRHASGDVVGGMHSDDFFAHVRDGSTEVVVRGTGTPRREFLHVDDMAEASLFVMNLDRAIYVGMTDPMLSHINVGTGKDVSIRELAEILAEVTGFKGRIVFDPSKPDGTPRKLMDVMRLASMGWRAPTKLRAGVEETRRWFLDNADTHRQV